MINDYSSIIGRPGLTVLESVDSTNNYIKSILSNANDCPYSMAVISDCQTGGRGRYGRSFVSPADTGIYLTYAFRSSYEAEELLKVTPVVAALAHRVLSPYSDTPLRIKWVNDLYNSSGKISGVLTELVQCRSGCYVVIGIGINVRRMEQGDPSLEGIVGHLSDSRELTRGQLAAGLLEEFDRVFARGAGKLPSMHDYYREHCMSLGRELRVMPHGDEPYLAEVLDIDEAYALIVRPRGEARTVAVSSGEVSVSV